MGGGRSSEELASIILEHLGFEIIETRKPIEVGGIEVAEIDLLAKDENGETYAVEVKSGRASVTDVRQAYSNAQLIGAKPMIVCHGFSGKSAEAAALSLNVRSVLLPEYYLLTLKELKGVIEDLVLTILSIFEEAVPEKLEERELKILECIAESSNMSNAIEKSGFKRGRFIRILEALRRKGVFPIRNPGYRYLRMQARLVLRRYRLRKLLERIHEES
ncbi:MAG TPA: hypothetical protein ENF41_04685 [Candidatus Bathyarchaeota archaeon]|nr:hypothetical protein [Candidatus Bathyarchaeota archaeon]